MNKLIKALGREMGWIILVCTDIMIRFIPEGIVLMFMEGLGRIVSVIPGGLFEITLSIWLIVKGFNKSVIVSMFSKTGSFSEIEK